MSTDDILDLVERARPAEALVVAQEQARANPSDAALRVLLFELYCVAGLWDRALAHATVAPSMDPRAASLARYAPAMIAAERQRLDVWSGTAPPDIVAPAGTASAPPWCELFARAFRSSVCGDEAAAEKLRREARELAPPAPGRVDGRAATSIADVDERLGPMLEVFIAGRYRWVPFEQVATLTLQPPARIIDRVWLNGELTLGSGQATGVAIPVRYPNSERPPLGSAALAASTEWSNANGTSIPIGQRLISLGPGEEELPILSINRIERAGYATVPAREPPSMGGQA